VVELSWSASDGYAVICWVLSALVTLTFRGFADSWIGICRASTPPE